ncbi:hypothetical protein E0H75_42300 [Kribbella capetownensis]|uniref:Lipoprotein n=1 Tax=Kribbella capetownensis TaxID=1572659 RepID=A0A4V2M3Z9_9ACTN|nr:hypothetical protein [Kribbella capetownensis]TCC33892.1 hypothetical protein E0H75_42300 [Kribbella capetownensis]
MNTRIVVASAAVVLLAAGCGGNDAGRQPEPPPTGAQPTPGTPGTSSTPITPQPIPPGNATKTPAGGLPRPSQVNGFDASTVAAVVAAVTYRYDTAIDNSPSDAQRRAKPWLAPALAAQLDGGPAAPAGAEWATWVQHRAYTTSTAVDATEDGAPADTATRADRTIAVTMQPVGRDRWRGTPQRYALYITLTRASAKAPWQISQLQVQE